jgi:NAD+ synthase
MASQKIIKHGEDSSIMSLELPYKDELADSIQKFILENARKDGVEGVVLGLSGGLDSATAAKLSTEALGGDKVLALIMPDEETNPQDTKDAVEFADLQGMRHEVLDITGILKSSLAVMRDCDDRKVLGNLKARCRMLLLYYYANADQLIVVGTGNKSELSTGYFTKYGDGAADILPLGNVYKTQVYQLAKSIGIPGNIIQKVPSAGLWRGQTDEGELMISYEDLDRILYGLESGNSAEKVASMAGLPIQEVRRIQGLVDNSAHKRRMPPCPEM